MPNFKSYISRSTTKTSTFRLGTSKASNGVILMENDFQTPRALGRSGLVVGRLGLASSYGAPAKAFEKAFERGCNFLYWGSIRTEGMRTAIRHLVRAHGREKLVVVLQSFSRWGLRLAHNVESGLRKLNLEYADVLLLGWHNVKPAERLMEEALRQQERGTVRHLGISGHHRAAFRDFACDPRFEILMVRYNAAHRGAESEAFPYVRPDAGQKQGLVTYTATRWKSLLNPRFTPPGMRSPTAADCYRFVLSNPDVDVCLTGPASEEEMEIALTALGLGPLSEEEMQWMRTVGDNVHHGTKRSWNPFAQRQQ